MNITDKILRAPLHLKILSAIVLAVVAGQLTRLEAGWAGFGFSQIAGVEMLEVYRFVGGLFLRALQMVVVPLIGAAVIIGVAGVASHHSFGRMGARTLFYYFATTTFAVLLGLMLVNVMQPGAGKSSTDSPAFGLKADPSVVENALGGRGAKDVIDVFVRMIPSNIFDTASQNSQMLGLIFFAIVFGLALTKIPEPTAAPVRSFFEGLYAVMLKITDGVMAVSPVGIFGLVAAVSATTTPADFMRLFGFFLCVAIGLLAHSLITLPLLLRFVGSVSPVAHFRAMAPALLTAFSTSSSSATLPVTIESLEKRAGVSPQTASFVAPLGATINMDGTALYEVVAVLFIAQVYGVELSIAQQFIVALLALLTSVGVAGVPSASLVAIVVILGAMGLPAEAIGLLMVFDRILDMMRTSVNVFSDSCGAVIIAAREGEQLAVAARPIR
jgi:Na+/H+-dicarboxylate symporter